MLSVIEIVKVILYIEESFNELQPKEKFSTLFCFDRFYYHYLEKNMYHDFLSKSIGCTFCIYVDIY